jgi:hypothetical protein
MEHRLPRVLREIQGIALRGAAPALLGALGCAGQVAADGTGGGTLDPSARLTTAQAEPSASGSCVTAQQTAGSMGTAEYDLWTYDPDTRQLTQQSSDASGTSLAGGTDSRNWALYWRFDAMERLVRYGTTGGGNLAFRADTSRDDHENPVTNRSAYFASLDLDVDISEQADGQYPLQYDDANEYDETGALRSVTVTTPTGEVVSASHYEQDGEGRCTQVTWDDGRAEQRDYTSTGQLWHRKLTGWPYGPGGGRYDSIASYERDDQGRLTSVDQGVRAWMHLDYREDGSIVETQHVDTDEGSGDWTRIWSSGCGVVFRKALREPSTACAFETLPIGAFVFPSD